MLEMSEEKILQSVLDGRTEAYGEIFFRYREPAYDLALQYTRSKDDALDIVQESFIKAFQNLNRFRWAVPSGPGCSSSCETFLST